MRNTKTGNIKKPIISQLNVITGLFLLASLLTICIFDKSLWRGVTTAKYFYFSFIICLALPLMIYLIICRKLNRPLLRSADIPITFFVMYIILHRLFMGGGNEMHWWLFLLMIPYYIIMRAFTESRHANQILTNTILIVSFIQTLWGFMQLFGLLPSYHQSFPITGSLFNPAPYAGFVATSMPLALYQLRSGNSVRKRILGGTVLAMSCIILPFTESRAAWIAALVGVLLVAWQKITTKGKKFIVFSFMALVASIILLYGLYHMKKDSADGRLLIWNVSSTIIKKHPVFGVGSGRFASFYGQAQADYFLQGKGTEKQTLLADHPDYAFNELIHIAVELGILGLILYLLVIVMCLFQKKKQGFESTHASLVVLIVFGFFSYPFSVLPLVVLFVGLLAAIVSQTHPLKWQMSYKEHIVWLVGVTLLTVAVACKVLPRLQSYKGWHEASGLFRSGSNIDALDEYLLLYPKLRYEKNFLIEYGFCLSRLSKYEESNQVLIEYLELGCNPEVYNYLGNNYKAMGQYDKAEQSYLRSSFITPNRHYPEYLLMKLYNDTGKKTEASEKAQFLIDKPVKVISPVIRLIRNEAEKTLESSNFVKEYNHE